MLILSLFIVLIFSIFLAFVSPIRGRVGHDRHDGNLGAMQDRVMTIASMLIIWMRMRMRRRMHAQRNAADIHCKNLERALDEHAILLITDAKHKIIHANEQACRLLQFSRTELVEQDLGSLGRRSGLHCALREVSSATASGKVWRGEMELLSEYGRACWMAATVVPFLDKSGRPHQFYIIANDITAQKEAQRTLLDAKRMLEEKNASLAILSRLDSLTELANRRAFDGFLVKEFGRARREQESVALLMIDIDFFKLYNDALGHPAGDACLRTVAQVLASCLNRSTDMAARYGGEEFSLLLPCTGADGAAAVAARIHSALAALAIPHPASPHGIVTVSIGFYALIPTVGKRPLEDLIQPADQALYAAKAAGRNTAVLADGAGWRRARAERSNPCSPPSEKGHG